MVRRFVVLSGVVTMLGFAGFIYLPEIISAFDARFPDYVDAQLKIDRSVIMRLHESGYLAEGSEIVSEKNEAIACVSSSEHRVLIDDAADIPPLFQKAILASEDKTFFEHPGFDKWAIVRAFFNQYVLHVSTSGASTLTMQIAKDLRHGMGRRSTMKEKLGDMVMALRIEREFPSKYQLLRMYVNTPYFGRGQYGIEAASRAYFGKPAKELALHQVAFLVALINKPALPDRQSMRNQGARTLDEIKQANWQLVLRGTRRVLSRMLDNDAITNMEYAQASDAVDRMLAKEMLPRGKGCGASDYFPEHVRVLLKDQFPLNKGGLTVPVTRDDGLQDALARAVETTVNTYLVRHPNDLDNAELRAGALVIQFDGAVLAEVGNIDFKKFKYDVMTQGWRSPGSTYKIFTYGGLVEQLVSDTLAGASPPETIDEIVAQVTQRCVVLDAPIGVSLGRGRGVKMIQNFHSNSEPLYRGNISCALAIGESRNAAAMRAGQRAGIKHVIELTYRLGMPHDEKHVLQPYPTTAIGASDVNPLGMTGAAAFMNGGFKVTPRFMNDVCKDGKSLIHKDDDGQARDCDTKGDRRDTPERVMHPATSAAMMALLRGPVDLPTGTAHSLRVGVIPGMDPLSSDIWKMKPQERKARQLAFTLETSGEIAGKTGTATNADGKTSDVWLILFVPGPPEHPEKGLMLIFWMGKDSKDHPLGERGTGTSVGFAESGGRNWTHSAATVLKFLQDKRGYLKPGFTFQPIHKDEVLMNFNERNAVGNEETVDPEEVQIVDPSDPATDPKLIDQLPQHDVEGPQGPIAPDASVERPSVDALPD
jgi:membrane peptidoglycan carboxypeptidase